MQKDFILRLKLSAHAQKASFSSLSYSDKTTNDKFDGQALKKRELYAQVRLSFKISKKNSICKKYAKMWVVQDFSRSVYYANRILIVSCTKDYT